MDFSQTNMESDCQSCHGNGTHAAQHAVVNENKSQPA